MMHPPDDFDHEFEENMDHFMEEDDEEALEALREAESEATKTTKSPEKKRPKLDLPVTKIKPLEDITNEPETPEVTESLYRAPKVGERKVYRRIPLEGSYQSFTLSDGERFYVKLREEGEASEDSMVKRVKAGGLCGESYSALLEQAIQEQLRLQDSRLPTADEEDSGIDSSDEGTFLGNLWVEKFRPKTYMQLLSDDGTNRTLLHWLKLWDKVVFNKELPKKPPPKEAPKEGQGDFKPKFTSNNELLEELDDTKRPQQKTALLYGPPGLGKTTLAHVVASHAGYNVVEINASDDRSLAAFKVKLDAATQMKSVSNQDQRPNCLVIDEIDGAPAATINYLVNLMAGKTKGKGSKKGEQRVLQRPIICICNDLYVPSLRPLRQQSLLLHFPPTSTKRLVQRLSYVCGKEHLRTDHTALSALCEKSGNDIRSCLSTLQFFKSKGRKMSSLDVHQTSVGNKDAQKSHFAVWQDLFQLPAKRKSLKESDQARFQHSLHMAMACGDYEKLQQGVFENYLNVKFKDTKFENVQVGNDWFCFFDTMHQHIMQSQTYSTMAYLPYTFVASHLHFAASGRFKVAYPTQINEMRSGLLKSSQIVESLYSEVNPTVRCFTSSTALVRDVLPCLLTILRPNLRPVNTQLFTKSEKEMLQSVITTLVAFSLNFVQERSTEGQFIYKLDPDIEAVAHFRDISHPQLSYAIKQLIAHEVEKEKMRRSDYVENKAVEAEKKGPATVPVLPNHKRQKLEAKQVEVKDHAPVDFFGRRIQPKAPDPAKEAAKKANEIIISDVWFKFKEGYNNAVRRNIRMKELL